MHIRAYLTIIVLVCLLSAYAVAYLVGDRRQVVQSYTEYHYQNEFAAKDFKYLQQNIAQFLISADLIFGSNETYLIPGAIEQTELLIAQLKKLNKSSVLFDDNELLLSITRDVSNIQSLLHKKYNSDSLEEAEQTRRFLREFDSASSTLVNSLEVLSKTISSKLKDDALVLEELNNISNLMQNISFIAFPALIFLLWFWANRSISKPLRTLSEMATKVNKTGHFERIKKGPKEVMLLSNELSVLTNSLIHQANHDQLTNLFNRREFERQLNQTIELMRDSNNVVQNTVCYIDLDRFKIVNDTCGHAAGDELLIKVADILSINARAIDILARVGGDEFTLLLKDCDINSALNLGQRLLTQIEGIRYKRDQHEFRISASIGLASISGNEENIEEVINIADSACRLAKESGRSQVQVLNVNDDRVDSQKREMLHLSQVLNAIDESRLTLYFQDIVPINNNEKEGKHYEILIRLLTEDDELISPINFLPIIERYQLSSRLDKWVVSETISLLSKHPLELDKVDLCSINLSGQSLSSNTFLTFLIESLQENEFPCHKLCFEITETAAISNIQVAMNFISELKKYGVHFALDDFGTGHSSFEYLKKLPVDYIKIDGSFVRDMLNDRADFATVKSITEVGQSVGKEIIAEFVHSEEIVEQLKQLKVDYAQGYYFAKPEPLIFKRPSNIKLIKC